MSAGTGFVTGVLALTALGAIGSSSFATGSIGAGLGTAATLLRRWSDPDIPAIPDLRESLLAKVGDTLADAFPEQVQKKKNGAHPSAARGGGKNRSSLRTAGARVKTPTYTAGPRIVST